MNKKEILKKLIKEMLDNWEVESSYVQSIETISPQEIISMLDAAIKGRHASGRKFHSAFLKGGMNENFESWPSQEEIENFFQIYEDKFKVRSARDTYDHFGISNDIKGWRDLPHTAQQILGSIFLFTGAHVPSVRDPDKYDPKKAEHGGSYYLPSFGGPSSSPGITGGFKKPSFLNYKMANHVMTILANRNAKTPVKVYRGIKVPSDPEYLEGLKPGIEFNNWPISSFTTSLDVANRFAEPEGYTKAGVVIVVDKISKGTDLQNYSYFSNEWEFVTSSKLRIKEFIQRSVRKFNEQHLLICEEA